MRVLLGGILPLGMRTSRKSSRSLESTQLVIVWPDRKGLLRRVRQGRRYKNSNVVGVMHTGTSSGSQVSIDLGVFSSRGDVRKGFANPYIDGHTVLWQGSLDRVCPVLVGGSTSTRIIGVLVGQVRASVWSHQRLVMSVVVTRAYRATFGILPLNIGGCRWAK